MTSPVLLPHLLEWGTRILFWVTVLWPAVISAFWPWWKDSWGRNLVSFDCCIAITLFPTWLNVTFGVSVRDSTPLGWVELAGICLVILNIAWRTVLIIRAQARGARDRAAEREKQPQ